MNFEEALLIALSSECGAEEQLSDNYFCNRSTGTWWIDLNIDQPGCSPACVIDVNDGSAEINWRCTGAIPQEDGGQIAVETETPIAELVPGTLQDVSFQGISFTYDDRLADGVTSIMVPAKDYQIIEGAIVPGHAQFSFDAYSSPAAFHQPRLYVYPVAEFAAGNELTPPIFEIQEQLLIDKPVKPDGPIPFLPLFNAGPLMQTQIKYLDFQNGSGIRFLTQYGQAYLPINNRTMFYTFQGRTNDGQYYVSLVLPVSHPSLPADESEFSGADDEAFINNFESYAREMEEQLEVQEDATFAPDLVLLDAVVQSLEIDKGQLEQNPQPQYDLSGWQLYNNETFGYSFRYPPSSTVRETEGEIGPAIYSSSVGGESWPIFSVNHYDSDFYRPPAGTEVRQWVLDYGIPHDVIGADITIGGSNAVHLITEASSGSYGFEEYYFIKGEQLFRILIWPSDGNQEWQISEQFLAGFSFLN